MTSINPNYTGTAPTGGTSGPTGPGSTRGAEEPGLFTPPAAENDPAAIERENKKKALQDQLAVYQAQKAQLEQQLAEYTAKQNKLIQKNETLEARENTLKAQIAALEANREADEAESKKIKAEYDNNNVKLLDIIKKMNDKIAEVTNQSAQAVQDQQKKTESATAEAFKKYQDGEITEDQIGAYIANKTGSASLLQQAGDAGLGIIEAFGAQIKGLISQMSGALNSLNEKKFKMESTSQKINGLQVNLNATHAERMVVVADIEDVQVDIDNTNIQIAGVNVNISQTQGAIEAVGNPDAQDTPPVAAPEPPQTRAASVPQNNEPGPNITVPPVATNNPFVSVTTAIDYAGFKSTLDMMMEQTGQNISNLRAALNVDKQNARAQRAA